jgi:hypothetical protein
VPHAAAAIFDRARARSYLVKEFPEGSGKVMDLGMHERDYAKVICGRYGCSVVGVEANRALASIFWRIDGLSCKNAAISAADGAV